MTILFSLIMIVMISCMFFPSCKTAEEILGIRGNWRFAAAAVYITKTGTFVFTGSSESTGTVIEGDGSGTWTVNNKQISFNITFFDNSLGEVRFTYTGTIHSEKSMTGKFTVIYIDLGNRTESGTWKANK